MRLRTILVFVLLILASSLISCGCKRTNKKQPTKFEYEEYKLDSKLSWLNDDENFNSPNYYDELIQYYDNQIDQKNYLDVSIALKIVAENEMFYSQFNPIFSDKLEDFRINYSQQLPWYRTLFIETHKGYKYVDQGKFRMAIKHFKNVISRKPINYLSCLSNANVCTDIAYCYSSIGDQENAIYYNKKALHYFKLIDIIEGEASVYNNLALVQLFSKNYSEAENYFDQAIEIYLQLEDKENTISTLHNKILLLEEKNDPQLYQLIDSTYNYYLKSKISHPSLFISLSSLYIDKLLHENNSTDAKKVIDEMERQLQNSHSITSENNYYISKAKFDLYTQNTVIDSELLEKALNAVIENEHYQNQIAFSQVLKENAKKNGDYKKAFYFSEIQRKAQKYFSKKQMIHKTAEFNSTLEKEKREIYINRQEQKIFNKNITIALLITSIISIILTISIISNLNKHKQAKSEKEKSIQYTRQLLEKTEEERRRIAGDLHDSVSHELLSLKNSLQTKETNSGEKIDEIINDIRIISRNLHPIMFEKVGLAASIEQLVERTQTHHNLMVTSEIEYHNILTSSDELQVYRIIQEALSNIIKYANAVAAKITLNTLSDQLTIKIMDNGKGFNVQEKLSNQSSFGLLNIIERSKALGGVAKIHSDQKGTIITVEIKREK